MSPGVIMSRISLTADEIGPGVLPPVCMVCGGPATCRLPLGLSWAPGASFLLLAFGILPFAVGSLALRQSITVDAPTCGRHRRHWLWRRLLLPTGALLTLSILLTGVAVGANDPSGLPEWAFRGAGLSLAATVAGAIGLRPAGVRATAVSPEAVTFAGVAPGFVAAVEVGRAEYQRQLREWLGRNERPAARQS